MDLGSDVSGAGLAALMDSAKQNPTPFDHVYMSDVARIAPDVAGVLQITDKLSYYAPQPP